MVQAFTSLMANLHQNFFYSSGVLMENSFEAPSFWNFFRNFNFLNLVRPQ